jgi:hypothetical protein
LFKKCFISSLTAMRKRKKIKCKMPMMKTDSRSLIGVKMRINKRNLFAMLIFGSVASGVHASDWSYGLPVQRFGSAPSLSNAVPGTSAGDAAYARAMRIEYAKDGLANSTAKAESAMRQQSAQSANCGVIVQAATTARQEYVVRHMAPDPTKVIQGSTCFIDVMKIKIPKSGYAAVDKLVSSLADHVAKSQCVSTSSYWDKIAKAAKSGNIDQLKSTAITAGSQYVKQEINTGDIFNGGSQTGADSYGGSSGSSGSGGWTTQYPDNAGYAPVPSTAPAPAPVQPPSMMDSVMGWIRPGG